MMLTVYMLLAITSFTEILCIFVLQTAQAEQHIQVKTTKS